MKLSTLSFALVLAGLTPYAWGADLLANGDFELGSHSDTIGTGNVATELGTMKQVDSGNNYGPLHLVTVNNWNVTAGTGTSTNRAWHIIDNSNLLGSGATNNLMRIDGSNNGGENRLQYTQSITLTEGDQLTLKLLAIAENSSNQLFARLVDGSSTIALLGADGVTIEYDSVAQTVNSGSIQVTDSGDYILEIWALQDDGIGNHIILDNVSLEIATQSDSDNDGMPDSWEDAHGLNKNINDAGVDIEPDGLTNLKEYQNNTDPQISDSDQDGLNDGLEVKTYGTNPLLKDSDGDGLTDGDEANTHGTDPTLADTDGDKVNDALEITAGTNPNDSSDFPRRPNIVLFLADDMGWQHTSVPFYYDSSGNKVTTTNNGWFRTPNMEKLASQGMIFTNAYAASVCSPTRVSIMTGMNPTRHHITNWTYPSTAQKTDNGYSGHLRTPNWRIAGMNETDITLPNLLKTAGYRSIHIGKAHFAPNSTVYGDPLEIGFDVNIAGHGAGGPGSYWGDKNYSAAWRGGGTMWDVPHLEAYHGTNTYLTEACTLEMNKEIEKAVNDGTPFFAYMSHYAPHGPHETDSRFAANYPSLSGSSLAYATQVEGMDKSLGDILTKLEQLGIAENTLVIFASDNGGVPFNGLDNQPARSIKASKYEGGVRVPMIAAWAKVDQNNEYQEILPISPGSRDDHITSSWDYFPTILGAAGVALTHQVDGHDLRPYFTGKSENLPPNEFFLHFPNTHSNSDRQHYTILRQDDWKLIYSYHTTSYELYNLADDIGETTDLSSSEPERLMAMSRTMKRRLQSMDAQYPYNSNTGSDEICNPPYLPSVDSDGDNIFDINEDTNGNGLVDPGETNPDNANSDEDNIADGEEIRLGLDPLDPQKYFYLSAQAPTNNSYRLTWPSAPGTSFTIRYSTDLINWSQIIATGVNASSGTSTSYDYGLNPGQANRFFRVELEY